MHRCVKMTLAIKELLENKVNLKEDDSNFEFIEVLK